MKRVVLTFASVVSTAAIARGQPLPDVPIPPDDSGTPVKEDPAIPPNVEGKKQPPMPAIHDGDPGPTDPYPPPAPPVPQRPLPPLYMPEVLTTPTGWLLPAAVLYSKTAIDTGGGVSSDTRVGLGDVAEFGVQTTDAVRERDNNADIRAERIQPYVMASFRLGVSEGRLFDEQPGMTLGFRKSFERNHGGFSTRVAELTLVASKHLGPNIAVHFGGAFWDASLEGQLDDGPNAGKREVTLHDMTDDSRSSLQRQMRPFGGIEVRPLPRSQILIDLGWSPEFCYRCTNATPGEHPDANKIQLKPVLSWGVRYEIARWMRLESGVRVPDIGEANLLDAQIFGQLTFTSFALRRGIDSLK